METIELDGSTWWRVAPLSSMTKIKYGQFAFNPVIWGMSISLWTIAVWLAIDLIFQLHVTFRRWGGMYYWTVLCTSIGIGIHAGMLIVKAFNHLTKGEEIAVTIILKIGDIMNQTGFSLVLYSRLNLVLRTSTNPRYLRWILMFILVGSFLVNTPLLIFNIGVKVALPNGKEWFARNMIAERVLVLWFTIQEVALSTLYTWTTASLIKSTRLKHQSAKTRRNLLLFMIAAQLTTFLADVSMVVLIFTSLSYKMYLHPFFFGIKLKVEFMALNQLQSLVQPNVNLFTFTGEPSDPLPHAQPELGHGVQDAAKSSGNLMEKGTSSLSDRPPATLSPVSGAVRLSRTSGVQVSCVESTSNVSDLERQYLGRHGR
jgi:hypothetical protein